MVMIYINDIYTQSNPLYEEEKEIKKSINEIVKASKTLGKTPEESELYLELNKTLKSFKNRKVYDGLN